MTTAHALADELVAHVPVLRQPITLAAVRDACRNGLSGPAAAALIDAWLNSTGTAREALAEAPATGLGDMIRDWSGWCEDCRAVIAAWQPFETDDHSLTFCPDCAVKEQAAHPESWRTRAGDFFDAMEAPGA